MHWVHVPWWEVIALIGIYELGKNITELIFFRKK